MPSSLMACWDLVCRAWLLVHHTVFLASWQRRKTRCHVCLVFSFRRRIRSQARFHSVDMTRRGWCHHCSGRQLTNLSSVIGRCVSSTSLLTVHHSHSVTTALVLLFLIQAPHP